MSDAQRIAARARYQAARDAFAALPRAEQEAYRAEFPPMSQPFAKAHGFDKLARSYNALRRQLNVAHEADLAHIRAVKAQCVELSERGA